MSPRRLRCSVVAAVLAALLGCDKAPRPPDLPPAQVWDEPIEIAGSWRGEVGGVAGQLRVQELDKLRFYGMFEARATGRRYVLNLTQAKAAGKDGALAPSNLLEFTWQDGHGDRGAGWLLVNRDGSAITGSYGRGEGNTDGAGLWTFVRRADEG